MPFEGDVESVLKQTVLHIKCWYPWRLGWLWVKEETWEVILRAIYSRSTDFKPICNDHKILCTHHLSGPALFLTTLVNFICQRIIDLCLNYAFWRWCWVSAETNCAAHKMLISHSHSCSGYPCVRKEAKSFERIVWDRPSTTFFLEGVICRHCERSKACFSYLVTLLRAAQRPLFWISFRGRREWYASLDAAECLITWGIMHCELYLSSWHACLHHDSKECRVKVGKSSKPHCAT